MGLLAGKSLGAAEAGIFSESIEWHLGVALDSHYVSEGRDNLDGDALFGATLEGAYGGLQGGALYADSPDADYRELNLYVGYGFEANGFEVTFGYTYLDFLSDDADDSEVGAGIAYGDLPFGLTAALEGYYSFEAEGSFLEASLSAEVEVDDRLLLIPSLLLGWNEGYIADGHDGANHFQAALEAVFTVTENIELGLYAAYTRGLETDPGRHPGDALLEDFFYGGIAISLSNQKTNHATIE